MSLSELLSNKWERSFPSEQQTNISDMEQYYPWVTAVTAVAAADRIAGLYADRIDAATKEELEDWKIQIDDTAATAMAKALHEIPFYTIKVGSEGDKEIHYAGNAAPSVKGEFGMNGRPKVHGVSDVVDGTTLAAGNKPGATSILAVTEPGGIISTPEDAHYMVKLIGPSFARGILSLSSDYEQNLRTFIKTFDLNPTDIVQVTMDPSKPGREVNQQYVDAAKNTGIGLELIGVGDFLPGVRAALTDYNPSHRVAINDVSIPERLRGKILLLVGRGGFEEGVLAAAAVKAIGGFMEAKLFHKDKQVMDQTPVWNLDDLVSGSKDKIVVSASFITPENTWFHKPGVSRKRDGSAHACTMIVSRGKIQFQNVVINNT